MNKTALKPNTYLQAKRKKKREIFKLGQSENENEKFIVF
jgi:hypothetical protein